MAYFHNTYCQYDHIVLSHITCPSCKLMSIAVTMIARQRGFWRSRFYVVGQGMEITLWQNIINNNVCIF